jgi:hypothetical protein
MASNTLSGTGVSPANTKAQLLHIGTGNLAAGAAVRLGDGTATQLTLSSAGAAVAGDISATGGISQAGPAIISGVQNLTGAGAVDVTHAATLFTSSSGGQALSLADGTHGQLKTIIHAADGGSGVLTPTTKTGFSTITFSAAGESATLQFITGLGWVIVAYYLSPGAIA